MPTTYANSINSNPIYAARAEMDASGNVITTTYATKAEIPSDELPAKSASDAGKALVVNSAGTGVEWSSVGGGSVSVSAPLSGDGSVGSPITLDYDTSCLSLKTTQAGPGAWFNPITTYSYCGLSSDVISALSIGTVYFRFTNLVSAENLDSPNESTGGYYHYISACPCLVPYDDVMGQFDATAAIYPWDSSTEDVFDVETGECSSWSCSLSNISLDSRLWYLVVAPAPYLSDDYSIHPNIGETANGDAQIAYQVAASAELTVSNPVPSATASDASKVLGVTATDGTLGWVAQPAVPPTKTLVAGAGVSLTEGTTDVTVAWSNSAGITDIVSTAALPASPVATVLYLIPEA